MITSEPLSDVLVTLAEGPSAGPTIVLLPHSGCNGSALLPVARAMPLGIRVVGVEYPGRGARLGEPFAEDLSSLAAQIAAAIATQLPRGVTVFGHSFGALVAFEVVRRLAERGIPVRRLFASSCVNPHVMAAQNRTVHLVPDDVLLDLLAAHGGIDDDLLKDPELLDLVLPIIRNDTKLGELHRPPSGAMIEAPITAVGGASDPTVSREDLAGWLECTSGGGFVELVAGGHFHVLEGPGNIARLLAAAARDTR